MSMGVFQGISNFFRKYPVKVLVAERRGEGGVSWRMDRATRVRSRDGIEYYYLKKLKEQLAAPQFKYLDVDRKGRPVLVLFSPDKGRFIPMQISNPPGLKIMDKEVDMFHILSRRDVFNRYQAKESLLAKYAPLIMVLMVCSVLAFCVFWLGMTFENMATQIAGSQSSFAAAIEKVVSMPTPGT